MNNNEIIELNEIINNEEKRQLYQCRICLEEEENIDLLISPCRCSGTSKYVHIDCLKTWRYQDTNAPAFHKCMECNESYIILNNNEMENERLFSFFNNSNKVFYFQLLMSLSLTFFIYTFDAYVNDYSLVKIFPRWNDDGLLTLIKQDYYFENIFYFNFSMYLQNLIFLLIYILRCSLFVHQKGMLAYLMIHNIAIVTVFYNTIWLLMLGMTSFGIYKFALISIFFYEMIGYKFNYYLIQSHNDSIRIINENLDTNVASMDNNPLNIIVNEDDEEEIADNDEIIDDNIRLLN